MGDRVAMLAAFPDANIRELADAAIIPGLINAHSHLELTAMRGFLDSEEEDFSAWLRKLTFARLERMTPDDLHVSAAWGACEAARAGVTCMGDSSDGANVSMSALREVGLRGTVFQESFGRDPRLANENFQKLTEKVSGLRELETPLVRAGVSPHAPYTVCARQLEMIADFALAERLPLMMHAAESVAEEKFLREGSGPFAESLNERGIEWQAPGTSTIQYLSEHRILETQPLLAHCVNVKLEDIELLRKTKAKVVHCPRSNAKLGHGRAPFVALYNRGVAVGLGSDSVASNNSCDILAEARFAILLSRIGAEESVQRMRAEDGLRAATLGGARALGFEGIIGELKEGLQADFAAISLSGTHQFPSYDPVDTVVFASTGRDVILTVVAGREVFADGEVQTADEARLRARVKEIAEKLES
ncbi:MAG: amidohydrolase family protein [Pyrinomonadaceae bacterium]